MTRYIKRIVGLDQCDLRQIASGAWQARLMINRASYPTALCAGPGHGDRGLQDGIRWVLARVDKGQQVLVYAPGRANIRRDNLLAAFTARAGVVTATWRTMPSWQGGPVLVAWPDRVHLGKIADDRRVTALCVVPWGDGELDGWISAANPEILGPAQAAPVLALDPVVEQGLTTLTGMVNHANHLAGVHDRRDAVAVLLALHDAGYELLPEALYSRAVQMGWSARGAERLRELARNIGTGTRPRLNGPNPLRRDIVEIWRQEASEA